MISSRAHYALLFILLIGWSACRPRDESKGETRTQSVASPGLNGRPVKEIDEAGLRGLAGQRNGRILFLNIWATWCAPCVEEFPDLVKLAQTYDSTAVEIVGISADYPDEIESKIVPFLRKQRVPFRIYVASFRRQEDFINAVDSSWSGALPASVIYDQDGKKRFFHVGQLTFEQCRKEIERVKGGT